MKKFISLLMALTMLVLCACGQNTNGTGNQKDTTEAADQGSESTQAEKTEPYGLYYDFSGLHTFEAAMTVDGNEIPGDLYCYLIESNCANLANEILTYYNYYGVYGDCVNEDQSINWDGELYTGTTAGQYVRYLTEDSLLFYASIENLAEELGVSLTAEDLAAIDTAHSNAIAAQGGEMLFEMTLNTIGLRSDSFKRPLSVSYLFNRLTELVEQEDSTLYLDPADYSQYLAYTDHILLKTTDEATGQPFSEDEIASRRATIEDLLSQLQAVEGEERMELFTKLADEYSEDPGHLTNPTGYIVVPGEMVPEFETAAFALQPGELSGIVETSYGYHILLGRDLLEGLESQPDYKQSIFEKHLSSLLRIEMDQAEVVFSDALENFDVKSFYTQYTEAAAAASGAAAESSETESAGDSADTAGESAK